MSDPAVFISYATPDKAVAGMVCQALEQRQIPCWMAPRNVPLGASAFSAINSGIEHCRVLILILSSNANRSDHVPREVQLALEKSKVILPFKIDQAPPEHDLAYILTGVQWLDAFAGPVERHVAELVESVEGILKVGDSGFASRRVPVPASQAASRRLFLWGGAAAAAVALAAAGAIWLSRAQDDATVQSAVSERLRQILAGHAVAVDCAVCGPHQAHVNVQVSRGQVDLSGVVSAEDQSAIRALVPGLPGVKAVAYDWDTLPANASQQSPPSEKPAPPPDGHAAGVTASPGGATAKRVPGPGTQPEVPPPAVQTADQLRSKAFTMTGEERMKARDYVAAESNFQMAVTLDPDNATARKGLADAHKALGD